MSVCFSDLITKCAPDWEDSEVWAKRLVYTDNYCDGSDVYHNPHCANCNHVDLNETNVYSGTLAYPENETNVCSGTLAYPENETNVCSETLAYPENETNVCSGTLAYPENEEAVGKLSFIIIHARTKLLLDRLLLRNARLMQLHHRILINTLCKQSHQNRSCGNLYLPTEVSVLDQHNTSSTQVGHEGKITSFLFSWKCLQSEVQVLCDITSRSSVKGTCQVISIGLHGGDAPRSADK
jgi:hypothetical protein